MKVNDLLKNKVFHLRVEGDLDKEITGCYCGDLLSWVMSHTEPHYAWCTVLTHANVIAVAVLTQQSCIIICEDAPIDQDTIAKAHQERINLITTHLTSAEVASRILHD